MSRVGERARMSDGQRAMDSSDLADQIVRSEPEITATGTDPRNNEDRSDVTDVGTDTALETGATADINQPEVSSGGQVDPSPKAEGSPRSSPDTASKLHSRQSSAKSRPQSQRQSGSSPRQTPPRREDPAPTTSLPQSQSSRRGSTQPKANTTPDSKTTQSEPDSECQPHRVTFTVTIAKAISTGESRSYCLCICTYIYQHIHVWPTYGLIQMTTSYTLLDFIPFIIFECIFCHLIYSICS